MVKKVACTERQSRCASGAPLWAPVQDSRRGHGFHLRSGVMACRRAHPELEALAAAPAEPNACRRIDESDSMPRAEQGGRTPQAHRRARRSRQAANNRDRAAKRPAKNSPTVGGTCRCVRGRTPQTGGAHRRRSRRLIGGPASRSSPTSTFTKTRAAPAAGHSAASRLDGRDQLCSRFARRLRSQDVRREQDRIRMPRWRGKASWAAMRCLDNACASVAALMRAKPVGVPLSAAKTLVTGLIARRSARIVGTAVRCRRGEWDVRG